MRTLILSLIFLVSGSHPSDAASRTWKDRKGNEIKAEFTGGVLQNKLVFKVAGNRRIQVRLSDLCLEDRDFIVQELTAKDNQKDLQMLRELMLAENQVPVIDPDAVKANPTNDEGTNRFQSDPGNAFNPLENPNVANQPMAAVPTEMYGLPLPSPELLVEDQVRTWTSLTGLKQLATLDRVLAPGFLRLKKADGTKGTFALVNFSKADIEYVKEALQKDMARPVFPEGAGFQSLTPEDVGKGYKVWTDRKNVPLIGKFVGLKTKNVVIEANGEEREFPMVGLSEGDRSWVDGEVKRRAEAAAQQASAQQAARQQEAANRAQAASGSPYSRFGDNRGSSYGGGHGESSHSSANNFPRTTLQFEYRYTCFRCGHTWTGTEPSQNTCPNCNNGRTNSSASNASAINTNAHSSMPSVPSYGSSTGATGGSPTSGSGSGVYMTILYVLFGLGLLGGIAAGLFKAFG